MSEKKAQGASSPATPDESAPESSRYLYIPFGRYEGGRRAEYPADEVMVGRTKQRANLLNHLFSCGRRGSYLITGHRGSGKTSFVNHCLTEYRDDVYRRYLQRNVGRSFLWDRVGQCLLAGILILTGVILSQLLAWLVEFATPTILSTSLAIFLVLILSYPLLAAYETFRDAIVPTDPPSAAGPRPAGVSSNLWEWVKARCRNLRDTTLAPCIITLGLIAIAVWGLRVEDASNQSQAPYLALLLATLGLFFFLAHLFSLRVADGPKGPSGDPTFDIDLPEDGGSGAWRRRLPFVAFIPVLAYHLPKDIALLSWLPDWHQVLTDLPTLLTTASLTFAGGLVVRWRCLRTFRHSTQGEPTVLDTLFRSGRWHVGGALLLGVAAIISGDRMDISHAAWGIATVIGTVVLAFWIIVKTRFEPRKESLRLHPRPTYLLLLRGFTLVVVGVQLLHPVIALAHTRLRPNAELSHSLFGYFTTDLLWAGVAFLLLIAFAATEYEWIIRPYASVREDYALHSALDQPSERTSVDIFRYSEVRHRQRRLARQTIFWKVSSLWLPVLQVPVNLGFDELDQRLVIESMLEGLRAAYRRSFLHWSSPFTAISRGLLLLALIIISLHVGDHLFGLSDEQRTRLRAGDLCTTESPGRLRFSQSDDGAVEFRVRTPPGVPESSTDAPPREQLEALNRLACAVGGEALVQLIQWRPVRAPAEVDMVAGDDYELLGAMFLGSHDVGRGDYFDVRLYHGLVFLGLLFISHRMARWWQVPTYRQIDRRMSAMLTNLSSTIRDETHPPASLLGRWVGNLWGSEVIRHTESAPFDPRTVELSFLRILQDMQDPTVQVPMGATGRISLPIPEVIFFFDELDKVGVDWAMASEDGATHSDSIEPLDRERERSRSLHKLFADLKNTISSGRARFLFVGGRNLHDEWLADQTARRPLLTSIFDLEIYVGSLLTDEEPCAHKLPGIEGFLSRQLFRARLLHRRSLLKRTGPWLSIWRESLRPSSYVQVPELSLEELGERRGQGPRKERDTLTNAERDFQWPDLAKLLDTASPVSVHRQQPEIFYTELLQFLAYRSKGNVKRLRELLETFIEPIGRLEILKDDLFREFLADHYMVFRSADIFRIQLIAQVYRQLLPILAPRVELKDDKIPQAILYLADFVMKFHRRGFSWSSMERVDELVHIHRAPDLRQALQEIIQLWRDKYLHPIRNGMYDFRMTSEMARELEYISRSSEQELAAFNFTLDESQILKAVYNSRILELDEIPGEEFITGLGELHKFDEEYELARSYFKRALASLDERFRSVSRPFDFINPVQAALQQSEFGAESSKATLTWGIGRLRLMLQIGMTYERTQGFENALAHYRDARTLAMSLTRALLSWLDEEELHYTDAETRWRSGTPVPVHRFQEVVEDSTQPIGLQFLTNLKQLNLLFQPLFAEAWISEKLASNVDTAPALVETELWKLRESLPFVNSAAYGEPLTPPPDAPKLLEQAFRIRHSNFALTMAELHNKAGDLLFFKGRQLVSMQRLKDWSTGAIKGYAEGYLMRAVYHYNLALHDIRRYTEYRRTTSALKFGTPGEFWPTTENEGWTDFVLRTAAGSLADLADAHFGAFSFSRLVTSLRQEENHRTGLPDRSGARKALDDTYDLVVAWLEHRPQEPRWADCLLRIAPGLKVHTREIEEWFDTITPALERRQKGFLLSPVVRRPEDGSPDGPESPGRAERPEPGNDPAEPARQRAPEYERMISNLVLSLCSARMLHRGAYFEAAGKQFLSVASKAAHLLWMQVGLQVVFEESLSTLEKRPPGEQRKLRKFLPTLDDHDILSRGAFEAAYPFCTELLHIGLLGLRLADISFRQGRPSDGDSSPAWKPGFQIPPAALTLACSLVLVQSLSDKSAILERDLLFQQAFRQDRSKGTPPDPVNWRRVESRFSCLAQHSTLRGEFKKLLENWTGQKFKFPLTDAKVLALLRESIMRRRYPALNHLNALKVLVDYGCLNSPSRQDGEESTGSNVPDSAQLTQDLDELGRLNRHFNSPLHFTPQQHGTTLAWYVILRDRSDRKRLSQARLELYRSEQMFTLRREFYTVIQNLFYLYDDFNDRSVHSNHAMQMASAEATAFLVRILDAMEA